MRRTRSRLSRFVVEDTRSDNRYLVFQTLVHTIGLANAECRMLDDAHRKRDVSEYEGLTDVDEALVAAVIRHCSRGAKGASRHLVGCRPSLSARISQVLDA